MRIMGVVFALALTLVSGGTQARAADLSTLSNLWASAWSAKKLDAVMAFYAPEPVFLPTVGPRWEGAAEIRKNFAGVLATYNPHIVLHSSKSESSGRLAYDNGTYEETITPVKGGAAIPAKGSYLFVFLRQKNGDWKILEQTWTELEPVKL